MEQILSHLWRQSSASGWMLVVIGLFGIWRLYVLGRPKMRELEQDAEEKMRAEMWRDIRALKASNRNTRLRLRAAEQTIDRQSTQIEQQNFVLSMVISELDRVAPGNPVAEQARALLATIKPVEAPEPIPRDPDDDLIAELDGVPGKEKQ